MRKIDKIMLASGFVLSGLGITAFMIYKRVEKLIYYGLKMRNAQVVEASLNRLRMNLYFALTNQSDVQVVISKQQYEVFLNDIYLTTVNSDVEQIVYPNSISTLEVKVDLDPKYVLQKIANSNAKRLQLITRFKQQRIKLVTKLWVKVGIFNIPVTIPYESTIENWGE